MTDSATSSKAILEAANRLRQLTQISIQSQWRYSLTDLPIAQATRASTWQGWQPVSLNTRNHVAWNKGRKVIWLGQQITVPHNLQGYYVEGLLLRLALTWWAEEAQVFVNGKLVQEGDLFDASTRILLSSSAKFRDTVNVALRLVSPGHDDGALVRSLCVYERADQQVNPYPEPGFVADELTVLQEYLAAVAPNKLKTVATAVSKLPWSVLDVTDRQGFDRGLTTLRQQLKPLSNLIKQRQIKLLGHAHLDLAWLWTVDETWKVAERTFQSVLELQKDFPELTFAHSTPALYQWLESNRPELFAAIRDKIAAGQWEVVAGLWIEPELNIVSGESIARQVLYGQRYVQEKFGAVNKIAWLPDTFGFSWQVPQILQQGEVEHFVTQKLRWNDTTKFPHELFWWKAPNGNRVLSLNSAPIGEGIDPVKMARYAIEWEKETKIPVSLWLPGVGDHGGGPTRDMLELARRWQQSPFFPQLEFTTALEFLNTLEQQQSTDADPSSPPTWNNELYLEFHRGCYTTHADQKWWNRRCEEVLYEAELFASMTSLLLDEPYPKADLETAWKQVLFNQFHDILPGTSIPQVFIDANWEWETAARTGTTIRDRALQQLADHISLPPPPHPNARAIVVFNSLNWTRSEVVTITLEQPGFVGQRCHWQVYDLNGRAINVQLDFQTPDGTFCWKLSFLAENIPAIGYRCFWLCPSSTGLSVMQPATTGSFVLENEFLRAAVDPVTGDLYSLFDKGYKRELISRGGNQLQAFQDKGQYWDAWNIDPNYAQHPLPTAQLLRIQYEARGPIATQVRVIRKIGQSIFDQMYILEKGSPILKVRNQVDWRERHVLMKVAFPLNIDAAYATYEIPYGAIERTTRPTTSQDKAKWEVPALRWADLSDTASNNSYGFSVLSDCKHGYDCQPRQIRLTLLRGAEWPDPEADRGFHQFTYALYPHNRDWRSAHTVRRGYEISHPLRVIINAAPGETQRDRTTQMLPTSGQFLNLSAENLVLTAFKPTEANRNQWAIRCYECHGKPAAIDWDNALNTTILGKSLDVTTLKRTNLLEHPTSDNSSQSPTQSVEAWTIATFVVNCLQITH